MDAHSILAKADQNIIKFELVVLLRIKLLQLRLPGRPPLRRQETSSTECLDSCVEDPLSMGLGSVAFVAD